MHDYINLCLVTYFRPIDKVAERQPVEEDVRPKSVIVVSEIVGSSCQENPASCALGIMFYLLAPSK